jgi:hypothetical protein
MNIEISDRKYWKPLGYDDGLLYVSLLEIDGKRDWRLPTTADVKGALYDIIETKGFANAIWYIGDGERYSSYTYELELMVIPVRDY